MTLENMRISFPKAKYPVCGNPAHSAETFAWTCVRWNDAADIREYVREWVIASYEEIDERVVNAVEITVLLRGDNRIIATPSLRI